MTLLKLHVTDIRPLVHSLLPIPSAWPSQNWTKRKPSKGKCRKIMNVVKLESDQGAGIRSTWCIQCFVQQPKPNLYLTCFEARQCDQVNMCWDNGAGDAGDDNKNRFDIPLYRLLFCWLTWFLDPTSEKIDPFASSWNHKATIWRTLTNARFTLYFANWVAAWVYGLISDNRNKMDTMLW